MVESSKLGVYPSFLLGLNDSTIRKFDTNFTCIETVTIDSSVISMKIFTPNKSKTKLVAGDKEGNLYLFDFEDFKVIKQFKAHDSEIRSINIIEKEDSKYIIVTGGDYLKFWDFSDYSLITILDLDLKIINSVLIENEEMNEQLIAATGGKHKIYLIELKNYNIIKDIGYGGNIIQYTKINDNPRLVIGSFISIGKKSIDNTNYKSIKLDKNYGEKFNLSCLITYNIRHNFNSMMNSIIVGGNKSIRIYNYDNLKLIATIKNAHLGIVTGLVVNELYMVSIGKDKCVKVWDLLTYSEVISMKLHTNILCIIPY